MAIKGVSLVVEEGQIVTILGANGAGKTTVLKTISGVMEPEKGSVKFMDRQIDHVEPDKIVKMGISHVPEGREVFHDLTVRENLMMGSYLRNDKDGILRDVEICYDYFPILKTRSKQLGGSMSGGEQQMLAIARALMARPKLLLLDEPSLGIAPFLVKEIYEIIKKINKEQNTTILLVEQNAPMALAVSHIGYVLELGRIVLNDTCAELMENEDVKEFYLGISDQSIRGTKRWKRKKKWR
ncbi:MAG: ABC transporter ATP-binding protein [Proteobacteria bacterium]|nr:ABC transporter ATP-binding protein [Pseudomonadota bacterium]